MHGSMLSLAQRLVFKECSKHHKGTRLIYAGRAPTAAVATGYKAKHMKEEMSILADALLGDFNAKPVKVETGIPVWGSDKKD